MLDTIGPCLLLAGLLLPLRWALSANRHTSLRHALLWAGAAGGAWALVLSEVAAGPAPRHVALCLTGAAGVAVLGARRPYVGAWNFVVAGLLAVLLLPLAESLVLNTDWHDPLRIFFMAATIAVGVLNYLPTRAGPAAAMVGLGCAGEMTALFAPGWLPPTASAAARLALALSPWAAWLCWPRRMAETGADGLWLDFRDRYGLLWGQRVREQFNHAARHAGWPVVLRWRGTQRLGPVDDAEVMETLRALLGRFMP